MVADIFWLSGILSEFDYYAEAWDVSKGGMLIDGSRWMKIEVLCRLEVKNTKEMDSWKEDDLAIWKGDCQYG